MTGVSTLGQALRHIENIKGQQVSFSTLSTQMASGKKTQEFSGLGADTLASLRSRTIYQSLEIYTNNLEKADIRIDVMLNSIEEYQAQTENIAANLRGFVQQGPHQMGNPVYYDDPLTSAVETTIVGQTSSESDNDLKSLQDHAENLFPFLIDLLNAQEGDRYVMAGADSFTKPVEDNGTLDAAMSTLITQWKSGTITTDELIADLSDGTALNGNPNAITDTIIGYSAPLSSGNTGEIYVRASEDSEFKFTTLANEDPFRNILVALSFLKNENLPPVVDTYESGVYPGVADAQGAPGDTAEEMQDNFYQVLNHVIGMVADSIDQIDQVRFRMETVRVQMTETKQSHESEKNLMLNTISDIEDVDTNEVAVRISVLKSQLEASYQVTSLAAKLSLTNYL